MEILLRIDDIQQMAWDSVRSVSVFVQILSRAKIHVAVNLPGIRADDLSAEASGEMDGEFCLAGSGRTCDDKSGVHRGEDVSK